ncbi:MAG: haloacid dehalogenase-like hydrolase [Longimicrobiales bacterium]
MTLRVSETGTRDPLPSWNDGAAKFAVLDFVQRVSIEASPDFIRPADRMAAFSAAGTLWPERPLAEAHLALTRIQQTADRDPSLWSRQPFKAAFEGDLGYLADAPLPAILELIAQSHAGMSQEQFEAEVRAFVETALHPRLGVPYGDLAYPAMQELLGLLHARGFLIWVCSGGTVELARLLAERFYEIPRHQIIGSVMAEEFRAARTMTSIWRRPQVETVNDYGAKPVAIARHLGRRPLLAAGSLQCRGDLPMLRHSRARRGASCQLLIHHDDPERELAYDPGDDLMMEAARKSGFVIVSMKRDWKQILGTNVRKIVIDATQLAVPRAAIALPAPILDQDGPGEA